jgi:Holliday junction resolvase RusA-like endonuclease
MIFQFLLEGDIVPKARARITSRGNFHCQRYCDWMETAIAELTYQKLTKGYNQELALPCSLQIVLINPKKRGDIDNLAGSIMDALVKAEIVKNDNLNNINNLYIKTDNTLDKLTRTLVILEDKEGFSQKDLSDV